MIGLSIGNYKILEQLNGTKNFGVYKAVDLLLNRSVYIKVPVEEFTRQPDIVENFRFEAATLAKLVHPNIPTLHSLTTVNKRMFMITEFLEGETLDKLLQKQEKISSEKAISIFTQIFDCLEFAHAAGIFHGDLKADRIFLTENDGIKILGFGKLRNPSFDENASEILPEAEISDISEESKDIYAVGTMLFEALTGENLNSDNIQEIERHLSKVRPAISEKVSAAVVNIFRLKAYGKSQSAVELKRDLLAAELNNGISTKVLTDLINKEFLGRSGNNNTAEYSIDFSQKENKSIEKALKRTRTATKDVGKNAVESSVNWKLARKNIWVGSVGILVIFALHFFFQFSFINDNAVQLVKDLNPTDKAVEFKQGGENEQIEKVESFPALDPFIKNVAEPEPKKVAKTETKAKNEDFVRKSPIVSPPIQIRQKFSSPRPAVRKKSPQETRAERLRRAEKILTGA